MIKSARRKYVFATALVVLILFSGFIYFRAPNDYIISKVPYYGFYNDYYFSGSSYVDASFMILEYWGGNNFTFDDMRENLVSHGVPSLSSIEAFFKKAGYRSETTLFFDAKKDSVKVLKNHFHFHPDVPVILYTKHFVGTESEAMSYRVVVGVRAKKEKVLVHDYYSGPNREITFDDFRNITSQKNSGILAIWPGNYQNKSYLNKENKMPVIILASEERQRLQMTGALAAQMQDIIRLQKTKQLSVGDAATLLKKLYGAPAFSFLPPAYRISFYNYFAMYLILSGKSEEAVGFLSRDVLPINENLDAPYDFWTGHIRAFRSWIPAENKNISADEKRTYCFRAYCEHNTMTSNQFSRPFVLLGFAYAEMDDYNSARIYLKKALEIHPNHAWAVSVLRAMDNKDKNGVSRTIDGILQNQLQLSRFYIQPTI